MTIGVLGSGRVGQAVGKLWAEEGHTVYFGSRHPEKLQSLVAAYGSRATAVTLAEAAQRGDVIFSALPYEVVEGVYNELAPLLKGKVVIEASNPFGVTQEGGIVSTLTEPGGVRTAQLLPESKVARAFNHIIVDLIPTHGNLHPLKWAIPVAADDATAREITNELVRSAGYEPVDAGSLADSALFDPGGELFLHMLTPYDMKRAIRALQKAA